MEIIIRKASLTDLDSLLPIQQEVQELHLNALPEQYIPVSVEDFKEWMRTILESGNSRVFVADSNSQIIGYVIVHIEERRSSPFKKSNKFALIDQLAVMSSARRHGVATLLSAVAIEIAKNEGCSEVLLDVLEFNKEARAFYEANGFKAYRLRMRIEVD